MRVNQARISSRILRFALADRFEVAHVGDDGGELFELIELIQLRAGLSLLKIPVRKAFGSSVSALTFILLSDVGYGRKLDCADPD